MRVGIDAHLLPSLLYSLRKIIALIVISRPNLIYSSIFDEYTRNVIYSKVLSRH
jgi:hypothetical protein